MKVVILCGGFGTRIRDVADDIPKSLIPVGEFPILWHIMKSYSNAGWRDFVLCLGYKGDEIKDFFLNYESRTRDFTLTLGKHQAVEYHSRHAEQDWRITFAATGLNAMTGSRVRKIRKYVADDALFMLTYGDGLSNVNFKELLTFHRSHGRVMTVTGVRPQGRFGELGCHDNGEVYEFNEKPQATEGMISGGFFVCDQRLFQYLEDRDDVVLEKEPMMRLVEDKQMMVYRHQGFWQPMDTYRDYLYLNDVCKKGHAPWLQ